MTRTRKKPTVAEVSDPDENQDREPLTDSEAVPDDLTAAAEALHQAARDAAEEEIRYRGEAGSIVAASEADADRVKREGHARALSLIAKADAAGRQSATASGRSKHLEHAARQEALAEQQEALAETLTAELGRVTETIAGLDSRLAKLRTDRERLDAENAAACSAGNVSVIADLEPLIKATDKAVAALTGQRETAQAQARQLGDGTETGPGALLDALTAAKTHRTALTKALDELYPDRPGAEHRHALDNLKGVLAGNLERIAQERQTAQRPQRQTAVRR